MYDTPTFNTLCTVHPHSILYVRYTHIKRFTYGTPHSIFYVWYTHIQYFMYGTPTLKQPAATTTTTDIEPTSNGTLADDMPPFRVRFMHSEWVLAKGAVETSVRRSVLLSVFRSGGTSSCRSLQCVSFSFTICLFRLSTSDSWTERKRTLRALLSGTFL